MHGFAPSPGVDIFAPKLMRVEQALIQKTAMDAAMRHFGRRLFRDFSGELAVAITRAVMLPSDVRFLRDAGVLTVPEYAALKRAYADDHAIARAIQEGESSSAAVARIFARLDAFLADVAAEASVVIDSHDDAQAMVLRVSNDPDAMASWLLRPARFMASVAADARYGRIEPLLREMKRRNLTMEMVDAALQQRASSKTAERLKSIEAMLTEITGGAGSLAEAVGRELTKQPEGSALQARYHAMKDRALVVSALTTKLREHRRGQEALRVATEHADLLKLVPAIRRAENTINQIRGQKTAKATQRIDDLMREVLASA